MTIESLLKDRGLISAIKGLVSGSGRSCPPSQEDELQTGKTSVDSVKQQATSRRGEEAPSTAQLNGLAKKEAVKV